MIDLKLDAKGNYEINFSLRVKNKALGQIIGLIKKLCGI